MNVLDVSQAAELGPFYHGTVADLQLGELLRPGFQSRYKPEVTMRHIYFTALASGGGLAAEVAQMLAGGTAAPRVYIVEPTGDFEDDPNVTDKKFPGNPTRSYRSASPLKIIGEATDWGHLSPEQARVWQERLANMTGEILN